MPRQPKFRRCVASVADFRNNPAGTAKCNCKATGCIVWRSNQSYMRSGWYLCQEHLEHHTAQNLRDNMSLSQLLLAAARRR